MPWPARYCLDTCLVSHELKLVFAYVPKAACTSIKQWLVTHGGFAPEIAAAGDDFNVHAHLDRHYRLRRREARRVLADPAYFKFTFVRNPLPRLVSAYLDKVVKVKHSARRVIRNFQLRRGLLGWNAVEHWLRSGALLDPGRKLTFREFAEQLARENAARLDPHFRPQSRLLAGLPLDFIGRVENSQDDFRVIQERLGVYTPLARSHSQRYAGQGAASGVADWPAERFLTLSAAPDWRRFYDEPLLAVSGRMYAEDFKQFGYHCDLGDTPSRVRAA
jgi:hypothetical protein